MTSNQSWENIFSIQLILNNYFLFSHVFKYVHNMERLVNLYFCFKIFLFSFIIFQGLNSEAYSDTVFWHLLFTNLQCPIIFSPCPSTGKLPFKAHASL